MPTTYNGIGTHYYGRKNLSTRVGPCRSCQRVGALSSYDTRLWFVVVFVPIIPLKRKRIIDDCSSCRRHLAADADKYEEARQEQVTASMERCRREGTPLAAIQAHITLLAFHDLDQSRAVRSEILAKNPNDALLRLALAEQMRQVSDYKEMFHLQESAYGIDPTLTEARAGVAAWKMSNGELDEARDLLDFLQEPGAAENYNLNLLHTLAEHFHKAGRHDEALDLGSILLQETPAIAQKHEFRRWVKKSERAVMAEPSMLPPRQHSLRGLFRTAGSPYTRNQRGWTLAALLSLIVVGGMAGTNAYLSHNRTLHVVNACGVPVQVQVDDAPPQTINGMGTIPIAEGVHHVTLTGAVNETHDLDIRSGYWTRWGNSPLWILNPGGEAVFDVEMIQYAQNPLPSKQEILLGKPLVSLPHVDYRFQEPPATLKVKRESTKETKVAVQWIQGQDLKAFRATLATDPATATSFAEHRLRRRLDNEELLNAYVAAITDSDAAVAFFRSGLAHRPVAITWHRAYQSLADRNAGLLQSLISEYDALLAREPTNAALLYLRGRIDSDPARQAEFTNRAIAAGPDLAWPVISRGMNALSVGRWADALLDLQKARNMKIDVPQIQQAAHVAGLALGRAGSMVDDDRRELASDPQNPELALFLADSLAVSGQSDKIDGEIEAWNQKLPVEMRGVIGPVMRGFIHYQAGRTDEPGDRRLIEESSGMGLLGVHLLLARGESEQAAASPAAAQFQDGWQLLAVALGLTLDGHPDAAKTWRDKAAAKLADGGDDDRQTAAILTATEPPTLELLDRVFLKPSDRAVLTADLAQRFPDRKADYL